LPVASSARCSRYSAAVDKELWAECPRGCGYRGARESINNHVNRHHRTTEK